MPSMITLHVSRATSSIRCHALVLGTFTAELYVQYVYTSGELVNETPSAEGGEWGGLGLYA